MTEKNALSISEALRRGREARGETIKQVQQQLGVALKILEGIEAGDFDVVEPIYARLTIWHYAEHVGLGGDAMATRFEQEVGLPEEPVAMRTDDPSPVPVASTSPVVTFLQRQPLNRLLGAVVLFIALLVAAVALVQQSGSQTESYDQPDDYLSSPLSSGNGAADPTADATTSDAPAPSSVVSAESASQTPTSQAPVTQAPVSQIPVSQALVSQAPATELPEVQTPATPSPVEQTPEANQGTTPESASTTSSDPEAASISLADDREVSSSQQPVELPTPAVPSLTTATGPVEAALATQARSPAIQDTTSTPATRTSGNVILEVRAIDSTWVQVQWDGVDGIEEIVPKGEIRRWYADQFFMVRAGRAHGVHFRLQGMLLGDGRLGEATKVLRFRGLADGYQMLGPELEPLGAFTPLPPPQPAAESVDAEHP
ncbi:MAG: hypothetical protein HN712_09150 [Gemmatimonadetes bacterium]|jgi:cytoskeletal protein RodZ|nr:hypothetical protein [Gemmatimonadota bacterium]MBT7860468.1 hypothetical protein [Gemmatimonadota bacterium]